MSEYARAPNSSMRKAIKNTTILIRRIFRKRRTFFNPETNARDLIMLTKWKPEVDADDKNGPSEQVGPNPAS